MFVLFINDLVLIIRRSQLQTFADDTKIAHPIVCINDQASLQDDLNAVIRWSNANNMELNRNKFELICHQAKANNSLTLLRELPFFDLPFIYTANDITIQPSAIVRDLGVLVDPQLNWEGHISKIALQARKMSAWVLNVFTTRDKQTMMLLFNSLVRSRLEYCCEVWDRHNVKAISKLEQVQRRFTSKIEGLDDMDYWTRLKTLNIYSLQRRRERQRIIHVWKIKNNLIRNDVDFQFKLNERTSRILAVIKPLPKIRGKIVSLYEESFSIRSAMLWNKIPSEITSVTSLIGFKSKLDNWLSSLPDKPPVPGFYHLTKNSIMDYCVKTQR